jgi:hypothetical protein
MVNGLGIFQPRFAHISEMKTRLIILICLLSASSFAQRKFDQFTFETGNAVSAMPIVGAPQLFYTNYHPYFTFGTRLTWKEKGKHAWDQSVNIGYMYHRYLQHTIPLFTEIIYRYNFNKRFNLNAHLGVGYLHSIPDAERFELNDQGGYKKIRNLGRAQGMVRFAISATYKISDDLRIMLNYGVTGQVPFVKSYVPLLPYNTIQVGVAKRISK